MSFNDLREHAAREAEAAYENAKGRVKGWLRRHKWCVIGGAALFVAGLACGLVIF